MASLRAFEQLYMLSDRGRLSEWRGQTAKRWQSEVLHAAPPSSFISKAVCLFCFVLIRFLLSYEYFLFVMAVFYEYATITVLF